MSTKTQLWTDTFLDARRLRADPLADAKAVAQARATGTAQAPGDFFGIWAVVSIYSKLYSTDVAFPAHQSHLAIGSLSP